MNEWGVVGGLVRPASRPVWAARWCCGLAGVGKTAPGGSVLEVLTADPRPLLVAIEDAQWLDQPSCEAFINDLPTFVLTDKS
jgi:hypothetical protein